MQVCVYFAKNALMWGRNFGNLFPSHRSEDGFTFCNFFPDGKLNDNIYLVIGADDEEKLKINQHIIKDFSGRSPFVICYLPDIDPRSSKDDCVEFYALALERVRSAKLELCQDVLDIFKKHLKNKLESISGRFLGIFSRAVQQESLVLKLLNDGDYKALLEDRRELGELSNASLPKELRSYYLVIEACKAFQALGNMSKPVCKEVELPSDSLFAPVGIDLAEDGTFNDPRLS